ncbi:MATE family efflux transporter [Mucilaginibacter segetis]|uniref:O-antigen/teichoic acid export membrane protein n=1 Tax=Mucilaginibacter segetis TaxID=2793071 RepID=A0A934PUL9_9SPHI|nr:hypothetical protein [Mucilaginibacter segetis]MBK0381139.1 hypothetical protein [Mucilaginibacter segetis]
MKNKVTESRANNDDAKLEVLITGTLQFYILMSLILLITFIISTFFISIFKSHLYLSAIIYLPIIFSFPFTLGHFIIQGLKKFNLFNSILFFQSFLWLLILLAFKYHIFDVNIYKLAICYSGLYVIANFTIISFSLRTLNFHWLQIFNFSHFKSSKKSLLVGTSFFILQISALFLYSIGNILTYNNLALKYVAQYDTVNKVFLLGMTLFSVIISVFWTEISHAKALKQKAQLNKLYKQLLLCASVFSVGICIVSYFIPLLLRLWTNNTIIVTNVKDIWPFAFLGIVQVFAYTGGVFLNAFEKLRGQIILSFVAAILMIPLSKLLFSLSVGIGSVPLSAGILTLPAMIFVIFKAKSYINEVDL